jgi:hypothetical protein
MIKLDKSLRAFGGSDFKEIFKQEMSQLDALLLPLQQGLTIGNYVSNTPITLAIHSVSKLENCIRVKAGVFYQGIIGGCSCTDDPTPISDINEYCEVQVDIDFDTAIAQVSLLAE